MRIESNLGPTIVKVIGLLDELPIHTEQALRLAAMDALALVQNRIEQKGQGINGNLTSKAAKKYGSYSRGWGVKRSKAGRQANYIDWNFNGDLWRAWQVLSVGTKEALIGFTDGEINAIADYLEDMHGEAFGLTEQEKEMVLETIKEYINKEALR